MTLIFLYVLKIVNFHAQLAYLLFEEVHFLIIVFEWILIFILIVSETSTTTEDEVGKVKDQWSSSDGEQEVEIVVDFLFQERQTTSVENVVWTITESASFPLMSTFTTWVRHVLNSLNDSLSIWEVMILHFWFRPIIESVGSTAFGIFLQEIHSLGNSWVRVIVIENVVWQWHIELLGVGSMIWECEVNQTSFHYHWDNKHEQVKYKSTSIAHSRVNQKSYNDVENSTSNCQADTFDVEVILDQRDQITTEDIQPDGKCKEENPDNHE